MFGSRRTRLISAAVVVLAAGGGVALTSTNSSQPAASTSATTTPTTGQPGTTRTVPPPPVLPAIPLPAVPPASRTQRVPASIDGTCAKDVTQPLTDWIASVPDNTNIELGTNACYRIEGKLELDNRHTLLIDGNGATVKSTTEGTGNKAQIQNRKEFLIKGGSDITLRNFTIQGVNTPHHYVPKFAGQHGIQLDGDVRVLIEHMTIREVYGDWVTVQSDHFKSWRWSSDVTIQHNTFSFAGRQGLSVTSGQHVLIQDNHLDGAGQDMVDIEPDGPTTAAGPDGIPAHGGADDVRFISNDVGKADALFFTVVGARANVNNVVIANNTLHGKALSMLILAYTELPRSNFLIENNTSDSPTQGVYGGGMIRLRNVTKAVIRNNVGPVGNKPAVTVNGSKDITVAGNQFPGSTTLLLVDQPPKDFSLEKPVAKAEWSATGSTVSHCGNSYGPAGSQADGSC